MLEFPRNGEVTQNGNEVGATGVYTCFPGYFISGQRVRTCQSDGEWSGTPPTCRRMISYTNIQYIHGKMEGERENT